MWGLRSFAKGIALGPDDAFVLVNETLAYRTSWYWLKGPKAGQTETFVDRYPGLPDDVRSNGRGLFFWIAQAADRFALVDWLQPYPGLKSLLAKTIAPLVPDTDARWIGSGAFVVAVDLEGKVVGSLQDPTRRYVTSTGVLAYDGFLYVGSVAMNAIGWLRVPELAPASTRGSTAW